ncbi:MAG TPA: type II toxin-antitoxin system VapC family toxin [Nitrococcus sp.]|nr:type II toxin-antitoxin system VapC family toxin [Nitrococcus sp.]
MVILYLDTSALAKLIVDEPESDRVEAAFHAADVCFTHPIAYVEAHSAIARRRREPNGLTADAAERARSVLHLLWRRLARTPMDGYVLDQAVALIQRHPLRTYDALHLAAAMWVRCTAGANRVRFACFDGRLRNAAISEGLRLVKDFPA